MTDTLLVDVEVDGGGLLNVRSPRVGCWREIPRPGSFLGPGARVGLLEVLNRTFVLRLPETAAGRIVAGLPDRRSVPVEYGQRLFQLGEFERPVGDDATAGDASVPEAAQVGTHVIVAPTDGVFYLRPSPEAPPFVEVGQELKAGQPVGLVEVMKTFNQILYDGAGSSGTVELVEVRCTDGEEVRAGQVLLVARER